LAERHSIFSLATATLPQLIFSKFHFAISLRLRSPISHADAITRASARRTQAQNMQLAEALVALPMAYGAAFCCQRYTPSFDALSRRFHVRDGGIVSNATFAAPRVVCRRDGAASVRFHHASAMPPR
jgi:hypothetical protein